MAIEIISIILSVLIVGSVITLSIIRKKNGKGCIGDCANCKYRCDILNKKDNRNNK